MSSISGASVTNSTFTDISSPPPLLQFADSSEDGTKVTLTYDQELSTDTAAPNRFTLTVDGSDVDVDSKAPMAQPLELTLASTIQFGQSISLAYPIHLPVMTSTPFSNWVMARMLRRSAMHPSSTTRQLPLRSFNLPAAH